MAIILKKIRLVGWLCSHGQGLARVCQKTKNIGFALMLSILIGSSAVVNAQSDVSPSGYKKPQANDSEFDNASDPFALYCQDANEDYQDTVFGELIYSEPSTSTKLEMLRLLSKETPSLPVFMHALSMGLSIDDMLLASLEYEPEKARELASSAVKLLPLLDGPDTYRYSTYNIGALQRYVDGQAEERNKGYVDQADEHKPYSIHEVVDKFFEKRLVLAPYPDWIEGQFHFMASAKELLELQGVKEDQRWYHSKSSKSVDDRPIFISLYEHGKRVLVDGVERIEAALEQNPNAQLPVVFIYNRLNERSIDDLGYPATLRGMRDAYRKENLMVTPTPQWEIGEYHAYIEADEFDQLLNLPEEDDFEPEAWNALLSEAENYDVNDTSILVIILPSQGAVRRTREHTPKDSATQVLPATNLFAAWDNPRTESKFKYASPKDDGLVPGLNSVLSNGLIVNRPDLIAALKALGVSRVPVAVYYLDGARVKPYRRGARSLIQSALGIDTPNIVPPGGGLLPPPPVDLPPASPPGLP